MKKNRLLLGAGGIGLIFIGLVIFRIPDKDVPTAKTQLDFSVSQQTVPVGKSFTLDIVSNPDGNAIILVEPHIQFDPAVLQLVKIEKSADYPQLLSTEQINGGSATITVGSPSLTQPVRTRSIVAHLTFQALKAQASTSITLTDQSFVGGKISSSGPKNILLNRTGAPITITN